MQWRCAKSNHRKSSMHGACRACVTESSSNAHTQVFVTMQYSLALDLLLIHDLQAT
jgi:hypothetical protein